MHGAPVRDFVRLTRFYLGLLLSLLPFSPGLAGETGEIISTLGQVEVRREGRWQAAQAGMLLAAGDLLRTGPSSRAAILLGNGMQIKLNAHSQLELKHLVPPRDGVFPAATQALRNLLHLLGGEIWVRSSGEPLEIQTVPATATIRGTEFTLAVKPDDTARLAVLQGLVEFGNPHGNVLVAANEQADVRPGEAPRKTVLLNPLDAVQWSLYYPALPATSGGTVEPSSSRTWTQTARQHLLAGQVDAARQALERALALDPQNADAYSLRSTLELTQNRRAEARADAQRAIAANPSAPSAWISLSWVQQAEFDLDGALASARQAVALDPQNPQALIQESSLLLGMGRLREAVSVAKRARQVAPDDAMVNTVWGFLQLAQNRVNRAGEAFEKAIAQDSTLGLPHLGLGLVQFRRNQTDAAIVEMRKATLLEPLVSLYNSYLGKAFYEVKQDQAAQKYLDLAKQLDPRDPTPWLYDAIRLQSINRPVQAVESLQKSIELNDQRGVYRSRLLLDEDQATRAATLGRTYNEVGFTQLGLQQGRQSVSRDPTNYSAHRLLADSYAALPGFESARVSQLLQAQLLQPINLNPVQPQRVETRLLMPSAGPLTPSLHEFDSLLVREQPSLNFSALGGTQDTWGNELIVSGLTGRFSYSLGQFHYQSNGYRENNDLENNIYSLFVQAAITPRFNLQAEYRNRETLSGDLASRFDGSFRAFQHREFDQETARIGARYSFSPQTDLIASVIYKDANDFFNYSNINETVELRNQGTQAEAQIIHRADSFNIITGLGAYAFDPEYSSFDNQIIATETQQNIYSYANFKIHEHLIWTIGLAYEDNENLSADINEFNPKLGVQWTINPHLSLRAAAFKAIQSLYAVEQTIEPTQVAGFNQLNDYSNMTVLKNYGVGLDLRFNDRLFGGFSALRQDNEVPFGILEVPDFYVVWDYQRDFYNAYLYWLPNRSWAVSASWNYEDFAAGENSTLPQLFGSVPDRLQTISLPVNIQYFDPSGFFAGLGVTYVNQKIRYLDPQSLAVSPTQNENFAVVSAGLGYRFPKRWGLVSLEATNLLDQQFHFQDDSFIVREPNPLYIPERIWFGRLVVNF